MGRQIRSRSDRLMAPASFPIISLPDANMFGIRPASQFPMSKNPLTCAVNTSSATSKRASSSKRTSVGSQLTRISTFWVGKSEIFKSEPARPSQGVIPLKAHNARKFRTMTQMITVLNPTWPTPPTYFYCPHNAW